MTKPKILLAALLPLVVFSCKDEPEQIPTYLRIEPFTVNAAGGAAAQEITEAWVYVNGVDFIGAYSLPALVPVLPDSTATEVMVYPGVKENGILSTPNIYPFLTRYKKTITVAPGNTVTIQPTTEYDPQAQQPWADRGSFDVSSINFEDRDGDVASTFELTTNGAFSGRSLRLAVDTIHPLIDIATESVPLPSTGANQVWLEVNYKSNQIFSMGLAGFTGSGQEEQVAVYQFNISTEWNKVYLNLTELVTLLSEENYRLLFHVSLPQNTSGQYTQTSGEVIIDNLRLVHF